MQHVVHAETLVTRTARALSQLSLEHEDGAFIGAEDDLLARLAVSRPTLRQAAKIAENDCLISVRRGIKGGFYAARPNADDAIRTLARFLRLRGATLGDVMVVSRMVSQEAIALACGNDDPVLRARLDHFIAQIDGNDSSSALIEAEGELARLIAELSGNPVIQLVMAIGFSFGMEEQGIGLYRDPGQRQQARKLQHELCRAIQQGDAEIARVWMGRRSAAMEHWIESTTRGDA